MQSNQPVVMMRSVLTVPVIRPRFVEKAPTSGADVICFDVEDSVPPAEKANARQLAREAVEGIARGPYAVYVRINGFWTGMVEDDLAAVVRPGLDGIVLAKANTPADVHQADALLANLERERGLSPGSVTIMPLIETAEGVMNAYPICKASPRLAGAIFGAEDYATDLGIARTESGDEVLWARTQVAIACHAARIAPIDTPDPDYTNEEHLEREMQTARGLGYRGKLVIHPTQIAIANRVFFPSPAELKEARAVVEAFEREGLAKGLAAIPVGGKMIDTPIYWRAKRLLDVAKSQGESR
jgi:citrate lyase subunit beta/citryl-CoA lyase